MATTAVARYEAAVEDAAQKVRTSPAVQSISHGEASVPGQQLVLLRVFRKHLGDTFLHVLGDFMQMI